MHCRPSRIAALNSIGFTWRVIASAWDDKYCALVRWRKFNGHTCVPISDEELGSWVSKQRQGHKRGKLTARKRELLDAILFTWSTSDADWDGKFNELCEWRREHGHTMVPFNEGGLGWWSNTQRQSRRKGKLSKSREERLNRVDFVWNPSIRRARIKRCPSSPDGGGRGGSAFAACSDTLHDTPASPNTAQGAEESCCTSGSLPTGLNGADQTLTCEPRWSLAPLAPTAHQGADSSSPPAPPAPTSGAAERAAAALGEARSEQFEVTSFQDGSHTADCCDTHQIDELLNGCVMPQSSLDILRLMCQ